MDSRHIFFFFFFFARGQHTRAVQTTGRRKTTTGEDVSRLLGAFKVIVLVLLKSASWVAAGGGMLPRSPAGMRVLCTRACTHARQRPPSRDRASRVNKSIRNNLMCAPGRRHLPRGREETSEASCAGLAVPGVSADPAGFKCHTNMSPASHTLGARSGQSQVSTLIS